MKQTDYDAIVTLIHQHSSKCSRTVLSDVVSSFVGKFPYNTLVSIFLNDLQRKVKRTYHAKSHEKDCELYYKIYKQRIEKSWKRRERCKKEAEIVEETKNSDSFSANSEVKVKSLSQKIEVVPSCRGAGADTLNCPEQATGHTTNTSVMHKFGTKTAKDVSVVKEASQAVKEREDNVKTDCKVATSEPVLIALANDFELPPFLMARLIVERYVVHQRERLKHSTSVGAEGVAAKQCIASGGSTANSMMEKLEKRMSSTGLKGDPHKMGAHEISDAMNAPNKKSEIVATSAACQHPRSSSVGNRTPPSDAESGRVASFSTLQHPRNLSDDNQARLSDGVCTVEAGRAQVYPEMSTAAAKPGKIAPSTDGTNSQKDNQVSSSESMAAGSTKAEALTSPGHPAAEMGAAGGQLSTIPSQAPRRVCISTIETKPKTSLTNPHFSASDLEIETQLDSRWSQSKTAGTGTSGEQISSSSSPAPRRVAFSSLETPQNPDRSAAATGTRPQAKAADTCASGEQISSSSSPAPRRVAFSTLETSRNPRCSATGTVTRPQSQAAGICTSDEPSSASPGPRRVAFFTLETAKSPPNSSPGHTDGVCVRRDSSENAKSTPPPRRVALSSVSAFSHSDLLSEQRCSEGPHTNRSNECTKVKANREPQSVTVKDIVPVVSDNSVRNSVQAASNECDHAALNADANLYKQKNTLNENFSNTNAASKKTAATVFNTQTSVKNQVTFLMKNLHQIPDATLREQVLQCASYDVCFGPINDAIRHAIGLEYEVKLVQHVKEQNLPFLDENDLRKRGYDKTPDIKLEVPIAVDGHPVCWIESKASFGDHETHGQYLDAQYYSYWNRFGPGLVIYWFGFIEEISDEMRKQGILIMDRFPTTDAITFMSP